MVQLGHVAHDFERSLQSTRCGALVGTVGHDGAPNLGVLPQEFGILVDAASAHRPRRTAQSAGSARAKFIPGPVKLLVHGTRSRTPSVARLWAALLLTPLATPRPPPASAHGSAAATRSSRRHLSSTATSRPPRRPWSRRRRSPPGSGSSHRPTVYRALHCSVLTPRIRLRFGGFLHTSSVVRETWYPTATCIYVCRISPPRWQCPLRCGHDRCCRLFMSMKKKIEATVIECRSHFHCHSPLEFSKVSEDNGFCFT